MRIGLPAVQVAARAGIAAGVSIAIARAIGTPHPIYAAIAAVIATDLDAATTRRLSLQRTGGTVLGALIGAALSVFAPAAPGIALGVFAAMLACHASRMGEAAKLGGFVCAIVLLEHTGDPWRYGVLRLAETLIGLAVAVAVSLVPKVLRAGRPSPPA